MNNQGDIGYKTGVGLQGFVCPIDLQHYTIGKCIENCPHEKKRCFPLPLLFALYNASRVEIGAYGVTELLNPPRITHYKRTHKYFSKPDDLVYMTFGIAWHKLLESESGLSESFKECIDYKLEESFRTDVETSEGKYIIKGRVDYITDNEIWDFKTSKSGFISRVQRGNWSGSDYPMQLNAYRVFGFPDRKTLKIMSLVKDHHFGMLTRKPPIRPIEIFSVPIIEDSEVVDFFQTSIEESIRADKDPLSIRDCSKEETWRGMRCNHFCVLKDSCSQFNKEVKTASVIEPDVDEQLARVGWGKE